MLAIRCLMLAASLLIIEAAKTREGDQCRLDTECFSGKCHEGKCSPDSPVEGKVGFGGHCSTDKDCYLGRCYYLDKKCAKAIQGQYCTQDSDCETDRCLNSKCFPNVKRGGRCGADDQCAVGLTCISQRCGGKTREGKPCGDDDDCYSGKCHQAKCSTDSPEEGKLGIGGHCSKDSECYFGSCHYQYKTCTKSTNGQRCTQDSECDTDRCRKSKCAPNHKRGVMCGKDEFCADGLKCIDNRCEGKVRQRGPCDQDIDCYSGKCHERKCATDSPVEGKVGIGGYCTAVHDKAECYVGSCGADSKCSKAAMGEHCTQNSDCSTDRCRNSKCMYSGKKGETCTDDSFCADGLSCIGGKCDLDTRTQTTKSTAVPTQGKQENGDGCWVDSDCKSNRCVGAMCKKANSAPGEPCMLDEDCLSSKCVVSKCALSRNKDGERCAWKKDCESDKCEGGRCVSSRRREYGDKKKGELCDKDEECSSMYCTRRGVCSGANSVYKACNWLIMMFASTLLVMQDSLGYGDW